MILPTVQEERDLLLAEAGKWMVPSVPVKGKTTPILVVGTAIRMLGFSFVSQPDLKRPGDGPLWALVERNLKRGWRKTLVPSDTSSEELDNLVRRYKENGWRVLTGNDGEHRCVILTFPSDFNPYVDPFGP